jgi:hypothetical protein
MNHLNTKREMVRMQQRWTGARVTPEIVALWKPFMFDVCGVNIEGSTKIDRDIFLTHTHNDHLPLPQVLGENAKIHVASPMLSRMERIYPNLPIVEEYTDFFETQHTLVINNRVTSVPAYCYFIKDAVVVPESDEAAKLVLDYKAKYKFVFTFKQPREHLGDAFDNHRDDLFLLDVSVWRPYRPNVIPKITFSNADREQYQQFMSVAIDRNRQINMR